MRKRQEFPGHLAVVSTPIGNVQDLSPRARHALESAEVILCEDTRKTLELLKRWGLERAEGQPWDLQRLDQHASAESLTHWVKKLEQGHTLALVSDAGTPGVSDPGAALTREVWLSGGRVVPIPGASAVTALVSVAGFLGSRFTFHGFLPREDSERDDALARARELGRVSERLLFDVWFESPERLPKALKALSAAGASRDWLVVGKELTKTHEALWVGFLPETVKRLEADLSEDPEKGRGEWIVGVAWAATAPVSASDAGADESLESLNDSAQKALECLLEAGVSAPEASKKVSQKFGVPRQIVYACAVEWSAKKTSRKS